MEKTKALLVVDVQNDFCPGGKLGLPDGDKIIPVLNDYIRLFSKKKLPILVTRDWHPTKTVHFEKYGGKWPQHCIQGTSGAQFHPNLRLPKSVIIISKGIYPDKDGYSVFSGEDSRGKDFSAVLKYLAIDELFIGGLATDYCVRHTALDALAKGFKIWLLVDAIKGVDKQGSERAIKEMKAAGAKETTFSEAANLMF